MLGKRVEVNAVKTELAPGGNPNFELLFSGAKSTQFSIVQKALGEDNMKKTIVVILEDLVNYFNVARPMTIDQIVDLAYEILPSFKYHKFEEILMFCEGIKKGKWGKVYERFDASIFWEFFEKYEENRNSWIEYDNTKDNYKETITVSANKELLNKGIGVAGAISNLKTNLQNIRKNETK